MNLLHAGGRPEPKPAHNCKTWFPNEKNPFENMKWENGRFVTTSNYQPSLIISKTKQKTSKHIRHAEHILRKFNEINFTCEDVHLELQIDLVHVYQIIQFLMRYSKIKKVGIVKTGKKRVLIYEVVK